MEHEFAGGTCIKMKKVGDIFSTNNYDMFSFMDENRGVGDMRVRNLKKSINNVGLLQSAPIIVNEKMQIIDGQGRYTVCKELGLPIYFTVQMGAGIRECIAMNASSTNWKMDDYIHSYARQGFSTYKFLEEQMQKYKALSPAAVVSVCADVAQGGHVQEQIKSGQFKLEKSDMQKAEASLLWIAPMLGQIKEIPGRRDFMITALNWIYQHSIVNKDRVVSVFGQMVFEIKNNNIAIGNMKQALQLLENAYNHRVQKQNKVRLVVEYEDYQNGTCIA